MEALTSADLLDVWERGSSVGARERALLLLGYARPDLPDASLGTVPIGGRDASLLRLRLTTFGPTLVAVTPCPGCGDALELELDASTLQVDPGEEAASPPITVTAGRRTIRVRRPTTDDLAAALVTAETATGSASDAARRTLIGRLLQDAAPDEIGPDLEAAVERAIALADPGLDLGVNVSCPACEHAWEAWIDVPAFLWTEIAASARRIAGDVAGLAAAYGWRESDVLELTPWRRQLYLELAAE
jgi:hypothetical protein